MGLTLAKALIEEQKGNISIEQISSGNYCHNSLSLGDRDAG